MHPDTDPPQKSRCCYKVLLMSARLIDGAGTGYQQDDQDKAGTVNMHDTALSVLLNIITI